MPVGLQRFNERKTRPNERITFIKPLAGPDSATSQDFLERVAAISVPIMRAASISVMTLEEHEPNREFLGRNFNAGEIVQLVLKSRSGRWLPFRFVVGVMMHELAHCLQMNHGRGFWKVNNQFRAELKVLQEKGYTGEGIWGRGVALYSGQFAPSETLAEGEAPENLCGGTYRTRRKKRKRGRDDTEGLSYAERKQRWIKRKFGEGGQSVGDDEETRILIEKGKAAGKPRVAKSKRGRELRAAAALLRFEQDKNVKAQQQKDALEDPDAESGSETDSTVGADEGGDSGIRDSSGRAMVRVDDEGDNREGDEDSRQEMEDLGMYFHSQPQHEDTAQDQRQTSSKGTAATSRSHNRPGNSMKLEEHPNQDPVSEESDQAPSGTVNKPTAIEKRIPPRVEARRQPLPPTSEPPSKAPHQVAGIGSIAFNPPNVWGAAAPSEPFKFPDPPEPARTNEASVVSKAKGKAPPRETTEVAMDPPVQICSVCSLENSPMALTCIACAHVLDVDRLRLHWVCQSESCRELGYVNSDDAGICGLCGVAKTKP